MTDALKGFLSGHQAGANAYKKRESTRKSAELAAKKRKEDFALEVTKEDRLQNAASSASWGKIQAMVDREDWAPEMANDVLKMAISHDAAHGGPSAFGFFKDQLNIEGPAQGPSRSGDVVSDVPRPLNEGFKSELQRLEYEAKVSKLLTSEFAGKVKGIALDHLEKYAYTDGSLDPLKAGPELLRLEAKMSAESGMDQSVLGPIFDNLEDDIGGFLQDQAGAMGEEEERNEYINSVSKSISKWVDSKYTKSSDGMGNVVSMFEGTRDIRSQMDADAQRKARLGWNEAEIKIFITGKYVGANGKWPDGIDSTPYEVSISRIPEKHRLQMQSAMHDIYRAGVDSSKWEPAYDEATRTLYLVNRGRDGSLTKDADGNVAARLVMTIPEYSKAPTTQRQDEGSTKKTQPTPHTPPIPVDDEGFPIDASGSYYRNKRWDFDTGKWVSDNSRSVEKAKKHILMLKEKSAEKRKEQKSKMRSQVESLFGNK